MPLDTLSEEPLSGVNLTALRSCMSGLHVTDGAVPLITPADVPNVLGRLERARELMRLVLVAPS